MGIGFEVLFCSAIVSVPFLQDVFGTVALGPPELLMLATFPLVVWGADELRRAHLGHRAAGAMVGDGAISTTVSSEVLPAS